MADDPRTNLTCLRQWETLQKIKRALVRQGALKDDASPHEVVAAMRRQVPPDLFGSSSTAK